MARRWGEARESQLRDGSLTTGKAVEPPTFSDFVDDDWLPVYPQARGNKPTTIKEKNTHIRTHLKPFFGSTRLDKIDARLVDRFVAELLGKTKGKCAEARTSRNGYLEQPKKLSAKRTKNVLGTLHTILVSANEWGVLANLPRFPRIKVPTAAFDFYNVEEAALLVASARDDERLLLLFALHTGCRAGEMIALEWTDVDQHSGFVSFSKSSTNGVTTEGTKSGKPRKVPISKTLGVGLKGHRHLKGALVFCQPDGRPLTLWHLHGALDRACRKAQLRRLRWHDLRHSFASNLVIGGTPLPQVQEWMGHSSITMTMRYAHLAPGGGREYLSKLDAPVPDRVAVAAE
jgi:integrase